MKGHRKVRGLLLMGWLGLPAGEFTWLANPLMLLGWVLFLRKAHRYAVLFALIALALMLSFMFRKTIVSSEAPTYSRIIGYGRGYWLWVASGAALLFGATLAFRRPERELLHDAP